jgi:hypothetical protein
MAANRFLRSLDYDSPELAQKLFESWPSPAELENQYNDFRKSFEADRQTNRLLTNPMTYLNENIPAQNTNAWIGLISRFYSRPADARQAFDRLIGVSEGQQRYRAPEGLSVFLEPTSWDNSLFRHYVAYLRGSDSVFNPYILLCDDQSITINYSDKEALQVFLRIAHNDPEFAAELVQSVPGLKEKAELVGGVQAISERGMIYSKTANKLVAYKGHKGSDKKIAELCEESKHNLDKVRRSLVASKSAKDFEFLSRAASASCAAVAEVASDFAREMVLNEPDAKTRVLMAIQILPYDPCGTSLGPEWVRFGFKILRGPGLPTHNYMRKEFEERFISRLAIKDFNRAMSYLKKAETPLARLQVMLAIIQGLDWASSMAKESKTQIN